VIKISCWLSHTGLLLSNGSVRLIGSNTDGQCTVPRLDHKVVDISCGFEHTGLLLENGDVCLFGRNKECQCECPILEYKVR